MGWGIHKDAGGLLIMRRMEPRGMWNKPRPRSDPRLHTPQWRQSRKYWKRRGQAEDIPCWRRGCKINYDVWYIPGTRKVYPNAYVLGHVIGRDLGRSLGYDEQWLDSIENTRPECSRCSAISGYMTQSGKRRAQALVRPQQLVKPGGTGRPTPQPGIPLSPPVIKQAAAHGRW
jgi:hypothetical protein